MSSKVSLWATVSIGLIAVILLIWAVPPPQYQAQGILLPSKIIRKPLSSPSSVVRLARRSDSSQLLGYIHIEQHYPANSPEEIWKLAQQLAAKVGANAVIVNSFRVGSITSGHFIYVFQGVAVYLPYPSDWGGALVYDY